MKTAHACLGIKEWSETDPEWNCPARLKLLEVVSSMLTEEGGLDIGFAPVHTLDDLANPQVVKTALHTFWKPLPFDSLAATRGKQGSCRTLVGTALFEALLEHLQAAPNGKCAECRLLLENLGWPFSCESPRTARAIVANFAMINAGSFHQVLNAPRLHKHLHGSDACHACQYLYGVMCRRKRESDAT